MDLMKDGLGPYGHQQNIGQYLITKHASAGISVEVVLCKLKRISKKVAEEL